MNANEDSEEARKLAKKKEREAYAAMLRNIPASIREKMPPMVSKITTATDRPPKTKPEPSNAEPDISTKDNP